MPKFLVLVRATDGAEDGSPPSTELLAEMTKYNSSLTDAGILLTVGGLLASSKAARIKFDTANNSTVQNGPFEVSSLVSGFWLINVKDLQEAVQWARKAPFRDNDAVLEVRQVAGPEDFAEFKAENLRKKQSELGAGLEESQN